MGKLRKGYAPLLRSYPGSRKIKALARHPRAEALFLRVISQADDEGHISGSLTAVAGECAASWIDAGVCTLDDMARLLSLLLDVDLLRYCVDQDGDPVLEIVGHQPGKTGPQFTSWTGCVPSGSPPWYLPGTGLGTYPVTDQVPLAGSRKQEQEQEQGGSARGGAPVRLAPPAGAPAPPDPPSPSVPDQPRRNPAPTIPEDTTAGVQRLTASLASRWAIGGQDGPRVQPEPARSTEAPRGLRRQGAGRPLEGPALSEAEEAQRLEERRALLARQAAEFERQDREERRAKALAEQVASNGNGHHPPEPELESPTPAARLEPSQPFEAAPVPALEPPPPSKPKPARGRKGSKLKGWGDFDRAIKETAVEFTDADGFFFTGRQWEADYARLRELRANAKKGGYTFDSAVKILRLIHRHDASAFSAALDKMEEEGWTAPWDANFTRYYHMKPPSEAEKRYDRR